ncbi:MAG: zinc-binding dehydrogenase [Novosphingobium sp.]
MASLSERSEVCAPATMPVLRVHGAHDMRIDDIPVPELGPRDVLVRVGAVGVCGTDLGCVAIGGLGGGTVLSEPLPIGHEFAGVVAKVGSAVANIAVGQRCAVNPDSGMVGCGGPTGAFAPFIHVAEAKVNGNICPIPDGLSLERAALAEPLSVAMHGVNIGLVTAADKVVVLGAGPIGLCTVVCLRQRGVTDIVVADLSDGRLERARALGATATINPGREDMVARIGECHGTGDRFGMPYVDTAVFIDAAGSGKALDDVLKVARYKGRIVVVALHKKPLPIDLWKMMANEFSIAGSIAADREDEFNECLRLLADESIDLGPLVSHRFTFDEIEDAFRVAADVDGSAKVIVRFPEVH